MVHRRSMDGTELGQTSVSSGMIFDRFISVNGNVFKRFHFIGFVTVPNDFTSIRIIEAEKTNIGMALFIHILIHFEVDPVLIHFRFDR